MTEVFMFPRKKQFNEWDKIKGPSEIQEPETNE